MRSALLVIGVLVLLVGCSSSDDGARIVYETPEEYADGFLCPEEDQTIARTREEAVRLYEEQLLHAERIVPPPGLEAYHEAVVNHLIAKTYATSEAASAELQRLELDVLGALIQICVPRAPEQDVRPLTPNPRG
ncbi:MAG: hypothetical protein F4Y96_07165 [Chloroflexi bacterium]|nr:hypothetical protein [Chloroflexota bacterium]